MSDTDVVAASRDVLAEKSRSFSWAAWFLPASRRDDAAVVYAMCRLIDDVADETFGQREGRRALGELRAELEDERSPRPLVEAFLDVCDRRGLEIEHTLELIAGVERDLGEVVIENDRQLLRYCYQVAGTVGLMMCAVLGIDDEAALPHAVDLGIAMQLTNICRDVGEDATRGRVYLPARRLEEAGTSARQILDGSADRERVAGVVGDLLDLADRYYRSADAGMAHIPPRSRVGIVVASRIYRAIGVHLRLGGADAPWGRVVVPPAAKIWWVLVALTAYVTPTIRGVAAAGEHDASLHRPLEGFESL